jgi:hypothetical protein
MDASSKSHASRDVLVVDLGSLKAALIERAKMRDVSLSFLVRELLSEALKSSDGPATPGQEVVHQVSASDRVRVSLRMAPSDASTLAAAARRAQLPLGIYVCGLAARTPVLVGTCRPELVSAIAASTAAMSTLSRHLSHLVDLLKRGSFRAAGEYVGVVTALPAEVRCHLALAAEGLAALQQPRERTESLSDRLSASRRRRKH